MFLMKMLNPIEREKKIHNNNNNPRLIIIIISDFNVLTLNIPMDSIKATSFIIFELIF